MCKLATEQQQGGADPPSKKLNHYVLQLVCGISEGGHPCWTEPVWSWLSCKRYTYERFGCRQTPTTMALILTRNAVSSSVSNKSCIIKHISKNRDVAWWRSSRCFSMPVACDHCGFCIITLLLMETELEAMAAAARAAEADAGAADLLACQAAAVRELQRKPDSQHFEQCQNRSTPTKLRESVRHSRPKECCWRLEFKTLLRT